MSTEFAARHPDTVLEATGIAAGKELGVSPQRYDSMVYRRAGRSGLMLPAISLGAWLSFGGYDDPSTARQCFRLAFDLGITHFDFANNYGTPPGQAEIISGEIIRRDLPRDELIISSKAGHRMWPGPYGEWCSKKSIVASCEQSLKRLGVDYLDVFYLHRADPGTPIDEQLEAVELLIRQGKILYSGLSSWAAPQLRADETFSAMQDVIDDRGLTPFTLYQPEYSMLHRGLEESLFPKLESTGTGAVAFRTLASGLLSDRYLSGDIPAGSRGAELWGDRIGSQLESAGIDRLRALSALARERGQTLAQMAIAWSLRLPVVTTVLVGVSTAQQLRDNVAALDHLDFTPDELSAIDDILDKR